MTTATATRAATHPVTIPAITGVDNLLPELGCGVVVVLAAEVDLSSPADSDEIIPTVAAVGAGAVLEPSIDEEGVVQSPSDINPASCDALEAAPGPSPLLSESFEADTADEITCKIAGSGREALREMIEAAAETHPLKARDSNLVLHRMPSDAEHRDEHQHGGYLVVKHSGL
ncbi:hypothetical protein FI667_g16599, partial [Globisporangium splendens]